MTALQFIRDGHTAMQAVKAGYKPSEIIMAAQAVAKVQPFRFPMFADEASLGAAMMATIAPKYEDEVRETNPKMRTAPPSTLPEKTQAAREYAKREGRITQAGLRKEISIGSSRSREILNGLVREGLLAKDGGIHGIRLEYRLAHLKPRNTSTSG